ncbi:AAA family ATPase [Burkholderia ubonensis]|uniref:AAA family ATPase n=1 Tax=Burkholderia ubonensis TaxID=101571 RepID=UPI000AF5649D|nr:ATP-binding protein [Burkholderia ubonensis]
MAYAVFICGPAGTGKSTVGKALLRMLLADGHPTCLLDKDTLTDGLSQAFMTALTGNGADRDSPTYKAQVRDLEYAAVLETARENLELGVSCIMPAPWTRELNSGRLGSAAALGFPANTRVLAVWLSLGNQERRQRIEQRGHTRDAYKLQHWEKAGAAAGAPALTGLLQLDAGRTVTELAGALRYHLLVA